MAALLGDATGSVWLAPFERTKQSVQAGLFTSIRASLKSVVSERGILGLYSGFFLMHMCIISTQICWTDKFCVP